MPLLQMLRFEWQSTSARRSQSQESILHDQCDSQLDVRLFHPTREGIRPQSQRRVWDTLGATQPARECLKNEVRFSLGLATHLDDSFFVAQAVANGQGAEVPQKYLQKRGVQGTRLWEPPYGRRTVPSVAPEAIHGCPSDSQKATLQGRARTDTA